ncbi:TlpA family protein disulfide reductase [Acidobacteriota bacterium]
MEIKTGNNRVAKNRKFLRCLDTELITWVENSGITFPVLYDTNSVVTDKLGIKTTPLKILIDNEGHILLIDPYRTSLSMQEEFIKEIQKFII